MDRFLTQAEVATIFDACEDSVVGWEMRGRTPGIEKMPKIIEAIGYLPIDIDTSTLGGKIKCYRYMNGVSQEKLAGLLGINESTVFHYEKGTHKPFPKTLKKLIGLFKS
jgi:DNA-binding XRE family transcriptional regulator